MRTHVISFQSWIILRVETGFVSAKTGEWSPDFHRMERVLLGRKGSGPWTRIRRAGIAPPENIVTLTCEVVEHLGSEVYIYMNTGKNLVVAKVAGDADPQINQDLDVVFDMSKVHFFDNTTEKTII